MYIVGCLQKMGYGTYTYNYIIEQIRNSSRGIRALADLIKLLIKCDVFQPMIDQLTSEPSKGT